MAQEKKAKTLADKFNEAALKIQGMMNTDIFRVEARNLCEKFELLWDFPASPEEKSDLALAFASVFLQTAQQIRTQTTVMAVQMQTDVTYNMYAALNRLAPEWVQQSNLGTLVRRAADDTTQAAGSQTNDVARITLQNSALMLQRIATACTPPPPTRRPGRRFDL